MVSLNDYKPLKLMAGDAEDLQILSACTQDAVIKIGDIAFIKDSRRFAFVGNRFVWECAADRRVGPFARVRTGVHFDDVKNAQFQYLRTDAKDAVVELLSIGFEAGEGPTDTIVLDFAGGGVIRLTVESVNAYLSDISLPWRTRAKPKHEN